MAVNPIDLTTVDGVKGWLNQTTTSDDSLIQNAITAFSKFVLTATGRTNLSSAANYTETYSGNGSNLLFVRNYPIVSVASLAIDTVSVPQSTSANQPGWVIDSSGSQAAIALRGGGRQTINYSSWSPGSWGGNGNAPPLGHAALLFVEGVMNVDITYNAGYTAPPYDLAQAATQLVAAKYRSRQWIEQISQIQPGVGSTVYSRLEIPNDVQMVLDRYRMRFIPS